jgi:hypothetical protein
LDCADRPQRRSDARRQWRSHVRSRIAANNSLSHDSESFFPTLRNADISKQSASRSKIFQHAKKFYGKARARVAIDIVRPDFSSTALQVALSAFHFTNLSPILRAKSAS